MHRSGYRRRRRHRLAAAPHALPGLQARRQFSVHRGRPSDFRRAFLCVHVECSRHARNRVHAGTSHRCFRPITWQKQGHCDEERSPGGTEGEGSCYHSQVPFPAPRCVLCRKRLQVGSGRFDALSTNSSQDQMARCPGFTCCSIEMLTKPRRGALRSADEASIRQGLLALTTPTGRQQLAARCVLSTTVQLLNVRSQKEV